MSQRHLVLQVETNSKQLKPKKSSLQSLSDISQKAVGPNLKQIVNHWDTVKHTQHDSQPLPNESRRGSYTPNVRNKVSSQSQLFRASSTNLKAEKLPKLSNQKVTSIKNIVEKATLGERVSSANWLNERNRRSNDNLNSQYMNEINDGKSWYEMDDPDKVSTAKIWFPEDVKKLKKRPQSGHSSHSGVKLVPLSQNSDLKLNASLALEAIEPIEKKSESSERKTQPLESQQSKTSLSSQDSVSSTRSLVRHKSQILVDLENSNTFEEFAQEYIFDGELNESKNSNLSDSIGFKPSDSQDLVVELAKWNRELKRASIDEIRRASVDVAIKEKITEEDELNNSINRSSAGSSMYDITFDVIRNATLQSEKDIVNTKYQKEIGKKEEILKPIITTEPLKPLIKTESLKSQVGSSRSNLLMSRAGSSSTLKSATTSSAALWKPGGRKGSLIWKPGGSGNEKLAEFLRNREKVKALAIQAKLEKKEKSKNSKIIVERELSNEQRREQNLRALVAEITRKANQAKSPKLPLGKIASAMSLIPDDIFPDPKNPQHTLKRDFVNVFVILDRRDTLIHENNQNKISRDTSAIQSILSPMQFPQIVDIIWTSFKYINTVDSVLDQNTCDFLIQLIIDHGNSDQVVFSIERVVAKLSKHDYITLKSTVIHFKRISELSRDTSISGLCSIIGPILFKSEIGSSVVDYLGPKTRLSKIVNSEQENFDSMEHLTESVVWERPADEATTYDDEVSRPVPGVRSVPDMELMDEEYYDSMIANQDPAKRKKTSIPTSTALTRAGSTISATKLPLECDSLLGKKDVVLISFFSQIAQSCSGHLLEVLIGKFDDIFSWNSERDIN